jgi:hypothetical protein
MSSKDELDRLEHDWALHIAWRNGQSSSNREQAPGKYVTVNNGFDRAVRLTECPRSVADLFWRDAEAVIGAALDAQDVYEAKRRVPGWMLEGLPAETHEQAIRVWIEQLRKVS